MKNILMLGICRTGKTTFSKIIQRKYTNYQIIELDTIISSLQKTVKNVPIGFIHDNLEENRLPQFLNLLIQKNIRKNGKELSFIINGDSILPKDLINNIDLDNMIVYYFVNTKLNIKEILSNCRVYDDEDEWTTRKTDEELYSHFKFYKNIEQEIITDCKKYGFKCIDTSINRDETFKKILSEIEQEI